MIKMIDLLVRDDQLSHEEFVERWQGDHADLARDLPGLLRYTTSVPTNPERVDYDGVLELYFEDTNALNAAFESEIGQEVQTDAAEFIDIGAGPRLIVEEHVQLDNIND